MNTGTNYADLFYSESANDPMILEKNVKDHPASAIARFLLLYHYKKTNDPALEKFAKQSSLYFNNQYWLQFQLLHAGSEKEESTLNEPFPGEATRPDTIVHGDKMELKEEIAFSGSGDEIIKLKDSVEIVNDAPGEEMNPFELKDETIERSPTVDNNQSAVSTEEETPSVEPEKETPGTDQLNNASFEAINEEPVAFELTKKMPEIPQQVDPINSFTNDEIIPLSQTNGIRATASGNPEEEVLSFEPLHTVDYFASQGIKIKEDALMDDKLGKQMKSFTAWLKSMKKLHPGKLPEQNEVIERIIQSSAEESNADADVLTEAMAEVLIKQHKEEKAIEMYRKLSLLNPSKSAYFAAKIESLKTN